MTVSLTKELMEWIRANIYYPDSGANLKGEAKYEFLKNMTVYSRLDLYSDYLHKPLNIDVNWEVQVNMIINKWFSTTLTTNLMYDDDVKIVQKDGTKRCSCAI